MANFAEQTKQFTSIGVSKLNFISLNHPAERKKLPRGNSKRKTFFLCCKFQLDINSQKALGLRIGILDIARALWFRWRRNPRGSCSLSVVAAFRLSCNFPLSIFSSTISRAFARAALCMLKSLEANHFTVQLSLESQ